MDVQAIGLAPQLTQVAGSAIQAADQGAAAQVGLMKDALELSGELVVELLSGLPATAPLGQNVDCYA
ncbi:MAG: hypothetical protein BWY87_00997 [Deltaproteobacteria bacterium ADurb.Bin510]|nr:MAG: hypothetical protein BWY87_00997 [Deltaproteobacteria bacterium ADurb.Bin510]